MPKRVPTGQILWLDNDKVFLMPFILRLKAEGYTVKQALLLTEGLRELEKNDYDLLILDIMLPVQEQEENLFPPNDTNSGLESGLLFYKKYKGLAENKGIPIFVFTIREDAPIRNKCLDAGLPPRNYMTKIEGADTAIFLARVKELIEKNRSQRES